jgi:NlpC/P60 family
MRGIARIVVLNFALFVSAIFLAQPAQAAPVISTPVVSTPIKSAIPLDSNGWPLHWWDCKLGQYWRTTPALGGMYVACIPGVPQWEWAPHEADFFALRAWLQRGKPYVFGAAGPWAFDCSGLTLWAARYAIPSRYLPHSARNQYYLTNPRWRAAGSVLRRGDLIFWNIGGNAFQEHVAIYLGAGWIINATGFRVQVNRVWYHGFPTGYGRIITN